MSKSKKIQQLTDLLAGRISKEDLAAERVYFHEQVEKDGAIVSDRTTHEGREVDSVPKGATIWRETKTYRHE